MKEVVDKCSTKGCSIDIGTVIDNDDCNIVVTRLFPTKEKAETVIENLRKLAMIASSGKEKFSMIYKINNLDEKVELESSFTFSCQAEKIIFELSLRSLVL